MKTLLLTLALLPSLAQADDLQLPRDIGSYRESLVRAFVKGFFVPQDTQIPPESGPTYRIVLTHDSEQTGDMNVYRFVRTAPGKICGGMVYQNVAGSNILAATDCL